SFLKVKDLAGRQPVTLIISDKDFVINSKSNSVRCAQSTGDKREGTIRSGYFHHFTPIWNLRLRACTSRINCSCKSTIKISVFIDKSERELMEIGRYPPSIADGLVLIDDIVGVSIDQLREFLLLQNVNLVINNLYAQRFGQTKRNS